MAEIKEQEVKAILEEALRKLVNNDSYLLKHDLHERTITHKLAEYLQPLFPDWNVDCEYNRDGHQPKKVKLENAPDPELDQGSNVYPDIIVHRRGNNNNNLLIIEAKKKDRPDSEVNQYDIRKIQAFSRDLNYQYGAAVTFLIAQENVEPVEFDFRKRDSWL